MEDTVAKEIISILNSNHDLLLVLMIIFGILLLITFGAAAYFFVKFKGSLNLIERYHRIFKLQDVEEYVSIVRKTADLKAKEEYDAKLSEISTKMKERLPQIPEDQQPIHEIEDDLNRIIPRLIVSIPVEFREAAVNTAWYEAKTHLMKSYLDIIRRDGYYKPLVPISVGEDGSFIIYSHAPLPGERG